MLRQLPAKLRNFRQNMWSQWLRCVSPLLAQSGHPDCAEPCPLSGVKETSTEVWSFNTIYDGPPSFRLFILFIKCLFMSSYPTDTEQKYSGINGGMMVLPAS
jgi:hypothetical protein